MSAALAADIAADIIADPDDIAAGRQAIPSDSPELLALVHYIARGIIADRVALSEPLSPTSPGDPGQLYHDPIGGFLYVCVAPSSWVRVVTGATW